MMRVKVEESVKKLKLAVGFMLKRIQDSHQKAEDYDATLDPRQRQGGNPPVPGPDSGKKLPVSAHRPRR
jgi:hypothetical protein